MVNKKVVVVGSGFVGATTVYTMMMNGTADEIVIIDLNREKAEGDMLDMLHGMSFLPPVKLRVGDYADCAGAALVILTAGAAQKPGETRLDLLKKNKAVFSSILTAMLPHLSQNAILLTVTNPVDVLTKYVLDVSGLPPARVIGSGTVLDTSRLRVAIARHVGVDARNVHTFVIGEHGDSEVAAFSATTVGGLSLTDYCKTCRECGDPVCELSSLHEEVRGAAYEIISKKGATYYAVALAVNRIAEAILCDQKAILTVSGLINGLYGIQNTCLSLPCVVGAGGIERVLEVPFSEQEIEGLRKSAAAINEA